MTELRLLVLGLLDRLPRSAYAVGQALGQMPAANFSGSPGAVYPAIKAMQRDGLVSRTRSPRRPSGGEHLRLTKRGQQVLANWLQAPIDGWDLIRAPGSILLRLSFLPDDASRARFRTQVDDAAQQLLAELQRYADSAQSDLAQSSSQSLELTRTLLRGYVTWAESPTETGHAI